MSESDNPHHPPTSEPSARPDDERRVELSEGYGSGIAPVSMIPAPDDVAPVSPPIEASAEAPENDE